MDVSPWIWEVTLGLTVVFFIFDVWHMRRNPHEPTMKECLRALSFYVGAAVAFGIGVWFTAGSRYGGEFFAGWLTEYSLSIDNLFIFIIIMGKFAVPREYQQSALMIGIILALVMRGIFIAVGAAAINNFSLGLLPVRRVPRPHRGQPGARGRRGRAGVRRAAAGPLGAQAPPGRRGVERRQVLHPARTASACSRRCSWSSHARHDRPAVRAGLHPRDLRPDRRSRTSC